MWAILVFDLLLMSSPNKWLPVVGPAEAKFTLLFFASLIKSSKFLIFDFPETNSRLGNVAIPAIGFKSDLGSKLSFAKLTLVERLRDANNKVYPSGALLVTNSAPIFPPAPGFNSVKTVCPSACPIAIDIGLDNISAEPPAAYGTTIFIGLLGKFCAFKSNESKKIKTVADQIKNFFCMIYLLLKAFFIVSSLTKYLYIRVFTIFDLHKLS